MKHTLRTIAAVAMMCAAALSAAAQSAYWVLLTDKGGTTFDPYTYFDAKALERYAQCGANLYDISNYPLSEAYVSGVTTLATDTLGHSRWLNAMAVEATASQIEAIGQLPYVARVLPIECGEAQLASTGTATEASAPAPERTLTDQLVRMQGQAFRNKGIDGRGVRVAVFDGGFPRVNTHNAFKHLRDDGRIIKTWNFCNRIENVYGWNSHGTMTLSCIAGREGNSDLGLATGAEFLLARTEVELEPAKEEVWWMQAMEWADRNGAQIISSSLGYGKERYYTRDMDGTSLVARAANTAAAKGILVCNSAGNEATDRQWRTIITPADADSVLCVGGIEHDLEHYRHISFSSYGPSADGRQKPNVVAFGHARTANVTSDGAYHYVDGTSFSCPLVAGFAACAIQAMPGKTAMQMIDELQRSADLYPYCDYAFGYGVPQATYFTGERHAVEPTFRFEERGTDSVYAMPYHTMGATTCFYRYIRPDGLLSHYGSLDVDYLPEGEGLGFDKAAVYNRTLEVNLGGYTAQYRLPAEEQKRYEDSSFYYTPDIEHGSRATITLNRNGSAANRTSQWGGQSRYRAEFYAQYGITPNTSESEMTVHYSDAGRVGMRLMRALSKSYCLGIVAEIGSNQYNYSTKRLTTLDTATLGTSLQGVPLTRKRLVLTQYSLELYQRVRFVPGGMLNARGLFWDLGLFANLATSHYYLRRDGTESSTYQTYQADIKNPTALDSYRFGYGVTTRFGYSTAALYARYNLSTLVSTPDVLLPRFEVGLELSF